MKHYLSLVFTLLLLVACDPAAEIGTPFHKGQEVVLTAAIGEQRPQMMPQHPHPQRISGKDSDTTIDLLWDEGDEIRVCVGETSSIFTLIDGAGTANASFKGTMPASGSSYEVTYPQENNDDLLQQQAYVPKGIAKGLMKMSTPSPGTIDDGFTLQAEHAVLGLQLTGNSEIGKLVLSKNGTDGKAAEPSYTLNCTSIVLSDSPTLFYIVLPTGTWEHGFTVTVYAADNTTIIDTFVTNKAFIFTAANATTMAAKEVQDSPKRIGVFSVGAGKKVSFSQGNLQYTQSTLTWQFASEQYEVIGADNIQDSKLADRIDLFGWSAQDAQWGVSTTTTQYIGEFVDWGVNTISGDAPNTWRTLSKDEWDYLISHRPHANDLHTKGSVEGAKGLIILPDNWLAQTGIALTPVADDANLAPGVNAFTADQWQQMEQAGAVFLPAAGVRVGSKEVKDVAIYGGYWSDTPNQEGNILLQSFHVAPCNYTAYSYRSYGRSVRLVHDTIVPMP